MIDYLHLFDTMVINPLKQPKAQKLVDKIKVNKDRYDKVAAIINVPWDFIGLVHYRESTFSFLHHLHNGDPLTAKTVHVPAGRPLNGTAPFTWEESAIDALKLRGLDKIMDWSIESKLSQLEKYNGLGYQKRGILSPYLWSYSNHYTSGKYVADGKYDPNTIDQQCGTAVLLKLLEQ